jgi:hypothetical protein
LTAFLKIVRSAPRDGESAIEFIELQPTGAVTRTVAEDLDGELLANSVAIQSHSSSAFADYAYGSQHPSLWTAKAPAADDAAAWATLCCATESIPRAEFERLFRRARPDIQISAH